MNKIKAVIIEDEFPAARLLNRMIQNCLLSTARSQKKGIQYRMRSSA